MGNQHSQLSGPGSPRLHASASNLRLDDSASDDPTRVHLSECNLKTFCITTDRGKNLERLNKERERCGHVKYTVADISVLDLSYNLIREVPSSISRLKSLRVLRLGGNRIVKVSKSIRICRQLEVLELNDNDIKVLPVQLFELPTLVILDLARNNIREVPSNIGRLRSLTELRLQYNTISVLPHQIQDLNHLQLLLLGGNEFEHIPEAVCDLPSLELLDLSGNLLDSLPESLGRLSSIRTLSFHSNRLRALPPLQGNLPQLVELSLQQNHLTSLPNGFLRKIRHVETLKIGHNNLTTIPEEMCQLVHLRHLALQNNHIARLPPSVSGLTHLKTLVLSGNRLRDVPFSLAKIVHLSVDLRDNPLRPPYDRLMAVASPEDDDASASVNSTVRHVLMSARGGRAAVSNGELDEGSREITGDDGALDYGGSVHVNSSYASANRAQTGDADPPLLVHLAVGDDGAFAEALESLQELIAHQVLENAARMVQRCYRQWRVRIKFHNLVRVMLAMKKQQDKIGRYRQALEQSRAAARIQATWRCFVARKRWKHIVGTALVASSPSSSGHKEPTAPVAAVASVDRFHYSGPIEFDQPDSENNLVLEQPTSSGGERLLHAASLAKLIEALIRPNYPEAGFVPVFLTTHLSFMSSQQLLGMLISQYEDISTPPTDGTPLSATRDRHQRVTHQLQVMHVIRCWIEDASDFSENKKLQNGLRAFVNSNVSSQFPVAGRELLGLLDSCLDKIESCFQEELLIHLVDAPPPLLPHASPDQAPSLLDVSPIEMARQMTLITHELLRAAKKSEFVKKAWNSRGKERNAPNILAIIDRFNQVSHWIASEVVLETTLKRRATIVCFWTEVASQCVKLQNYHGVMQICTGLQSSAVTRLKLTFGALDKKTAKTLKDHQDLMSMDSNFSRYRQAFRAASKHPPAIPFVGLVLSDLTFAEDGNPDTIDPPLPGGTPLLNFSKRRTLAAILQALFAPLGQVYYLEPVPPIQDMLFSGEYLEEKDLYAQSLLREPRLTGTEQMSRQSMSMRVVRNFKMTSSKKFSRDAAMNECRGITASKANVSCQKMTVTPLQTRRKNSSPSSPRSPRLAGGGDSPRASSSSRVKFNSVPTKRPMARKNSLLQGRSTSLAKSNSVDCGRQLPASARRHTDAPSFLTSLSCSSVAVANDAGHVPAQSPHSQHGSPRSPRRSSPRNRSRSVVVEAPRAMRSRAGSLLQMHPRPRSHTALLPAPTPLVAPLSVSSQSTATLPGIGKADSAREEERGEGEKEEATEKETDGMKQSLPVLVDPLNEITRLCEETPTPATTTNDTRTLGRSQSMVHVRRRHHHHRRRRRRDDDDSAPSGAESSRSRKRAESSRSRKREAGDGVGSGGESARRSRSKKERGRREMELSDSTTSPRSKKKSSRRHHHHSHRRREDKEDD